MARKRAIVLVMIISQAMHSVAFLSHHPLGGSLFRHGGPNFQSIARFRKFSCFMSTEALTTVDAGSHVSEMEVKKSRFIGYALHAETWKEAQEYIQFVRKDHPKARHVCFGFVAGVNPVLERCSDDGEPTGTAGLPILGGIKGEGLSDTVCVVVRYFGGIKLGAGGLIRAYGGAARQVLREAPTRILIPKSTFRVSVTSSHAGSIYEAVRKVSGTTSDEEYTVDGDMIVTVTCETQCVNVLRENLIDATRGSVLFVEVETSSENVES